ncbi:uncharacterized protein Dwil_GK22438 [Drosophila willistoni]|uniref:CG14292-PA n=1 Tax=Drosophila willistoni TaxID=7260 RepID=Q8I1A7_DROWI|nr:uncharacterized protein LOC6649853 [Drosophila willistoni]AAO01068.1 CG14292-PA [Drosophila willistoni]EDW83220.1 uncharacterized protein Dwil_GK22438 [Drosophila willistoni]
MKFAIILLVASIAYVSAQAQPLGGSGISPFAAANPYAAAFNPFLNGVFGGGAGAAGGAAAAPAPSFGFGGASVSTFFQSVVLQREAERLLSQPNFPSDLADQVLEVVASSEESIANCGNVALPWLQIRCVKPLLNTAKNQFKVIDDEFKARQTAAASSPAA